MKDELNRLPHPHPNGFVLKCVKDFSLLEVAAIRWVHFVFFVFRTPFCPGEYVVPSNSSYFQELLQPSHFHLVHPKAGGLCYDVAVFSSRLSWDLRPNPLSKLAAEKRREGARLLDLTESNPTHAGFVYPSEEILAAIADARALKYDPDPRGLPSARAAVCEYYAERGVAIDPVRVLLTASTSEAYAYLFKLLADPGDEILVPRPSYPLFEFLASLESVRVRPYPLHYDGAWHIDCDALEKVVTPRTRAIVVVNPNNPTGSFVKRDELERLEALGIAIISDEVFSDYEFAPDDSRVASVIGVRRALTFSMSGLSKIAGLPQMKLSWIVASGPGHETALDRLELIADTYLSVATPVQAALPKLLACPVRGQIRERTRNNLAWLRSAAAGSAIQVLNVEGGWYAIVQVPRIRSEEEWALTLLRDDNVIVQPGFFYDFEREAFLVLSLLTARPVLEEGVRRLLARL
jgi:alanine-synthesizing transaminase